MPTPKSFNSTPYASVFEFFNMYVKKKYSRIPRSTIDKAEIDVAKQWEQGRVNSKEDIMNLVDSYLSKSRVVSKAEKRLEVAGSCPYAPKEKVIINRGTTAKPTYYLGTVTAIRDGKVHVSCDDGYKAAYKPTKSRAGLIGKCKNQKTSRSKAIPDLYLKHWLSE